MRLYNRLDINGKINLKCLCKRICGVSFLHLRMVFTYRECFELIEGKLRLEGYDV